MSSFVLDHQQCYQIHILLLRNFTINIGSAGSIDGGTAFDQRVLHGRKLLAPEHFRQAREGRCAVGFLIKRHHDDAGFRRRVLRAGHMMAQPKEHVGGKPIQPVERRQPGQRPHEHRQHEQRRTGPHYCPADGHGLLDRKLPMPLVSTSGAQFTPARPQTDTK